MFLFPYSTDVHDGTIRLAALEIMAVCLLVHVVVSVDSSRMHRNMMVAITEYAALDTTARLDSLILGVAHEKNNDLDTSSPWALWLGDSLKGTESKKRALESRIREIKESSLVYRFGFRPARFNVIGLITSMFLHGGWLHLIGNMLFFYVCGVAMEKYWGFWRFLLVYLACGIGSDLFYWLAGFISGGRMLDIPLIGASGAIAGAMGAFMVTHFKVNVKMFYALGFWVKGKFSVPAYLFFGIWFVQQIVYALLGLEHSSGVAYTAHIGGFLLGGMFGFLVKSEDAAAKVVSRVSAAAVASAEPSGLIARRAAMVGIAEAPATGVPAAGRSMARKTGFYMGEMAPTAGSPSTTRRVVPSSPVPAASNLPTQPVNPAEAGWDAFKRNDFGNASLLLTHAMNGYFRFREQNRGVIVDTLNAIFRATDRLQFPALEVYQWAKTLSEMNLNNYAVACFDLAAATAPNAHVQKNALLSAAACRIDASQQLDRAATDLQKIIDLDGTGLVGQQAARHLEKLQGKRHM